MTTPRKNQTIYAVRIHDRHLETEPELATLMYTTHGPEGPWYDMATGHPDYIWELCELTLLKDELHRMRELCDIHHIDWTSSDDDQ